jgi:hypothetical protein
VMSPLEFIQRLAALVPRLRLHLIRFHGVLAPEARPREAPAWRAEDATPGYVPTSFRTCRPTLIPPQRTTLRCALPQRLPPSWARLLKRVFEIDIEHCPQCGGPLKIIAAIEYPSVITKITISVCPPEHRPEQRPGPSIDSNRPDPPPIPPPIRSAPWPSLAQEPKNAPRHSASGRGKARSEDADPYA